MNADAGPKVPRSRRERPAKAPLTREGIIDVALTILENEGLGRVTMRRIADALDTGPASLYVYVHNTQDLHAQILDALLGGMPPVSATGSWRDRLRSVLTAYATVLVEHPAIARMTMSTHPSGPHYFSLVESVLELLAEGGVPDDRAAWAVDLLLAFATEIAVEHGAGESTDAGLEQLSHLATMIAIAPGDTYPRIASLGDEMLSGTGIERFNWGVEVLLNGVLSTARPTQEPT